MSIASEMTALANAVRAKTGGSGTLSVAQLTSAINGMTPGANADLVRLIERTITSITIPAGVTTIGFAAFMMCDNLASVTIPASVTSIEEGAFDGCPALTDIYCGFAEGAVSGAPWGAENATIHYNSAGPA